MDDTQQRSFAFVDANSDDDLAHHELHKRCWRSRGTALALLVQKTLRQPNDCGVEIVTTGYRLILIPGSSAKW